MNVCLFGTGNIAHVHAQALKANSSVSLHGVFDLNVAAAKKFAQTYGINKVYESVEELIADEQVQSIHVLTPPDSHFLLIEKISSTGKHVFVEKPVVTTKPQYDQLLALPDSQKSNICVNQNSCFHPAFVKASNAIKSGSLGKIRYIECTFEPFLKQLAAAQFTHWMFSNPLNLLLEQAVHPLAQIASIAPMGTPTKLVVMPGKAIRVSKDACFVPELTAAFEQGGIPVTFRMRVGASFPIWRLKVVCDDGYAVVDMLTNNYMINRRSKFLEAGDNAIIQSKIGMDWFKQSLEGFKDYCLSQAGLKTRNDSFFLGMKGSIDAHYAAKLANQKFLANAEFGAQLVQTCLDIAAQLVVPQPPASETVNYPKGSLVTVFGATGFIGKHTIAHLLDCGYQVRAVARGIKNLGMPFERQGVELIKGDIKNPTDIENAIKGAKLVVNLAHGGGGSTFADIRAAMVDSALAIAKACEAQKVSRLIHVGSIASLYLGESTSSIDSTTSPDKLREQRGDYARAKADCDDVLEEFARNVKVQIINLRPGLVVGEGTSPLHSGIGFFNNEQHIIGWNEGNNPLPFILVSDVAKAIEKSLTAKVEGYQTFNLIGEFLPTARQYVDLLKQDLARPLVYHPSSVTGLFSVEVGKWLVKRVAGKKPNFPSKRDLLSRGLKAKFDISKEKSMLNWHPVADEATFRAQATKVHSI
jgi:2-alkyl-3-oxoalkanoate reductase